MAIPFRPSYTVPAYSFPGPLSPDSLHQSRHDLPAPGNVCLVNDAARDLPYVP